MEECVRLWLFEELILGVLLGVLLTGREASELP